MRPPITPKARPNFVKPFGRGQIALHISADFPHVGLLRKAALFEAVWSRGDQVIAYDLVFPAGCAGTLRRIVARNG